MTKNTENKPAVKKKVPNKKVPKKTPSNVKSSKKKADKTPPYNSMPYHERLLVSYNIDYYDPARDISREAQVEIAFNNFMEGLHLYGGPEYPWPQKLINMAFKDGTLFKLSFREILNLLKTGKGPLFHQPQTGWKLISKAFRNGVWMDMSLKDVKIIIKTFKNVDPQVTVMKFKERKNNFVRGLKTILTLGAIDHKCHCGTYEDMDNDLLDNDLDNDLLK